MIVNATSIDRDWELSRSNMFVNCHPAKVSFWGNTEHTLQHMNIQQSVLSYSKAFSVSAQKLTNPEWNPTNIFKIKEYTGTQEKIEINKMISTKKCPFSCLFHSRFEKNCQVSLLNITIQRSQKMKIWIQKTLLSFFSLASMVFEVR